MIRELAIHYSSNPITVHNMGAAEYAKFTMDEVMAYGFKLAPDICDSIRTCFFKIRSIRNSKVIGVQTSGADAPANGSDVASTMAGTDDVTCGNAREPPSADKTWEFLLKKLGPHKLGPRPRKMNPEFTMLLSDVVVSLSDKYNHTGNSVVTRSCLNIIQTALKYYYVVPSAERFRDIVLMQNLCPGQRLNYAFDYMHFDTGQLSQVIYLHNLQFKQSVPPTTVLDWHDSSPAGPIAAFLQLITDLELWLQDSDDPLGILGDTLQIRRPLDRNKVDTNNTESENAADENSCPDTTQKFNSSYGMVVNKTKAYLVDRKRMTTFHAEKQREFPEFHPALALLVVYARKNMLMESMASVAINALKLACNSASGSLV